MKETHSSEKLFIIACFKDFIGTSRLSEALRRNVSLLEFNWDFVLKTPKLNRMLPFIAWVLEKNDLLCHLPKNIETTLQTSRQWAEWENRLKMIEFRKLVYLFKKSHISIIPLKGVALTSLVYHETPFRSMGDIDILIKESESERTKATLLKVGFEPKKVRNEWHRRLVMKIEGRWSFVRDGMDVDLQWYPAFLVGGKYVALDYDRVWARATTFKPLGENVFMLSSNDQCLHLLFQLLNDLEGGIAQPIQLLDLALVMHRYGISKAKLFTNAMVYLNPSFEGTLLKMLNTIEKCFFEDAVDGYFSIEILEFLNKFFKPRSLSMRGFDAVKLLQEGAMQLLKKPYRLSRISV